MWNEKSDLLRDLAPEGIATLGWSMERPMDDLTIELGLAVRLQRELSPKAGSDRRSLSSVHGLGSFPWHTDAVQRARPPHWILLRALGETNTPTKLLDGEFLAAQEELRSGCWQVDLGSRSFFTSVVRPGDGAIRWNPDLMRPANRSTAIADARLRRLMRERDGRDHRWSLNEVLLIDNRRWLHSRPAVSSADLDRRLERMLCD